jgi:hypothetical protein
MESYEELRPYLFAIAYRMLGSGAEADAPTSASWWKLAAERGLITARMTSRQQPHGSTRTSKP